MSSSTGTVSKWIGSASAVVLAVGAVAAGLIVGVSGSGGGGSPTPPSGVTLVQADGGTNYYSQWSGAWAATWNSPSFLPIATFGQFNLGNVRQNGMSTADGNADAGVNTYNALANTVEGPSDSGGTDGDDIVSHGAWAIDLAAQTDVTGSAVPTTVKNRIVGWLYGDEMEAHTCGGDSDVATYAWINNGQPCTNSADNVISSAWLKHRSDYLRSVDTSRFVFMGYNHPWAWSAINPFCSVTSCLANLTDAGDVLGYDVYVLVESRDEEFQCGEGCTDEPMHSDANHPWAEWQSIQWARQTAGTTGTDSHVVKPILPDIETTQTDVDAGNLNTGGIVPTGPQIQALAWNAIIGGARGYTWFATCVCDTIGKLSYDTINDTTSFPPVHAAVKTVDTQVEALAPEINAQFASGYAAVTSGSANVMVKWMPSEGTNGTFYVFAATKQSASQTVTFSLNGAGTQTATGVGPDSGNTFSVSGGSVSMTFADANAVHVFKVANP